MNGKLLKRFFMISASIIFRIMVKNIEKTKTHKLKDNLCRSPLELVTLFWHDEANNSLNNDK